MSRIQPATGAAKALLRRAMRALGFEVYRMPRRAGIRKLADWERKDQDAITSVIVAGYPIDMYARSYLASIYPEYPEYSGELGRILKAAMVKYPNLALIDVGAAYGDTVAIAKSVADIPILCVEGDKATLTLLRKNMRQFGEVTIREALLGARHETVQAVLEDDGGNLRIRPTGEGEKGAPVELTTLDRCTCELPEPERYRVLKIDTEGFDCRILRGGMAFIRQTKPVIAMEYHRRNMDRIGEDGVSTLAALREIGYRDVVFFDNGGRLLLATSLEECQLLQDLHDYADGSSGSIFYYDLYLFHTEDTDLAAAFVNAERKRRFAATNG